MTYNSRKFDTKQERDEFEARLRENACPYRGLYNVQKCTEYGTGVPMLTWYTGSLD